MEAKEHYENLLGEIYGWMSGDFAARSTEFAEILRSSGVSPNQSGLALDLGAGDGAQTAALLSAGFEVVAVDFSRHLLAELAANNSGGRVTVVEGEIEDVSRFTPQRPEVIVCWGDTLAHLDSFAAAEKFLVDCFAVSAPGGKLLLSFRDYSRKLIGADRFIPVKSDDSRIMTCFLEYGTEKVAVTDIIHVKGPEGWEQRVSTYEKIRTSRVWVLETLRKIGFRILHEGANRGSIRVVAEKP